MKKLLLLAALASSSYAQSIKICANKTSGNLFLRPSCFGSERAITNLSALRGPQGPQGVPGPAGSFSSCYQITADVGAYPDDTDYTLVCGTSESRGELVYHSELFSPHAIFSTPQQGFSPWIQDGKVIGGGWSVSNEDLGAVSTIPTGLCCPF